MAEALIGTDEAQGLESTTVGIFRTATVVKGGRRFSFGALVVVGDRRGTVGVGYGKAPGVPAAIEKAQKDARKRMVKVNLQGGTLPHPVTARYGASQVTLLPAAPGSGVIAGGTVRAVLEMVGVRDCLTKATGSTTQKNLVKAAIAGLQMLRSKEQVAAYRGVELEPTEVDKVLEANKQFISEQRGGEAPKLKGPVNKVGQGRGQGGGRGGRGRRGRGGEEQAQQQAQQQAQPAAEAQPAAPEAGSEQQGS